MLNVSISSLVGSLMFILKKIIMRMRIQTRSWMKMEGYVFLQLQIHQGSWIVNLQLVVLQRTRMKLRGSLKEVMMMKMGATSGEEEEDKSDCYEEKGGLDGHMDSFHLAEQVTLTNCDDNTDKEEDCSHPAVREDNDPGPVQPADEDDDSSELDVEDPVLSKQLNKQQRKAIASARPSSRASSRNSYKDKGGKTYQNSKIQKQLAKW